jgi:hypothetical protein
MEAPMINTLKTSQLRFPFAVDDQRRMMPTEFIGAALFSALNRSAKPVMVAKMTEIGRMNGYHIVYKGRVLTQAHADVWLAIIEIFRRQRRVEAGCRVEFHAGQVLKMIGKTVSADRRHDLYEWITDMIACAVHIYKPGGGATYVGPMLFGKIDKLSTGEVRYEVLLHPVLCDAFARGYTGLNWVDRKAIGKNELALWLHQYLTAFPQPVNVGDIQQLSGQSSASAKEFRRRLTNAMDVLMELSIVRSWKVDAKGLMRHLPPKPDRLLR